MRFLFVDRIIEETTTEIKGNRLFSAGEPLRYQVDHGDQRIAPGIISEAIGQLASWKCIRDNDFTARPVFLFADKIKVYGDVTPGTLLDLEAEIHEQNDETLRFSGKALRNGVVVQSLTDCMGYFMPLSELEDPNVTKSRYNKLKEGGIAQDNAGNNPFDFFGMLSDDVVRGDNEVTVTATMNPDSPFYADHFPRMPVTPIVVLNEMIGAAACILKSGSKKRCLSVRNISGIKIKSFVRPGDQIQIRVVASPVAGRNDRTILHPTIFETTAELLKDGKRILRGTYSYQVEGNL